MGRYGAQRTSPEICSVPNECGKQFCGHQLHSSESSGSQNVDPTWRTIVYHKVHQKVPQLLELKIGL